MAEARKLKIEGVLAGIPDLFLPVPVGSYHGLYIELKTTRGTLSKTQKQIIPKLEEQGYKVEVCHGHQSAIKAICSYLRM